MQKKDKIPFKAFIICTVLGVAIFVGGNFVSYYIVAWLFKARFFSWVFNVPVLCYIIPIAITWATISIPYAWGLTVASGGGGYAGAIYGLTTLAGCILTLINAIEVNGFVWYGFFASYLPLGIYALHSVFTIVLSVGAILVARKDKTSG